MEKITIDFTGITRNTDNAISNDGECLELINLRIKDKALRPVPPPVSKLLLEREYSAVYRHIGGNFDNYICVNGGSIDAYIGNSDNGFDKVSLNASDSLIKDIRPIGNTLSVINDSGINYYLFKNKAYKYLGSKPPFPIIQFKLYSKETKIENLWCDIDPAIRTEANKTYTFDSTNRTRVTNTLTGAINRITAEATKEGYFVFPVIARYALRLFDGNYILHSSPVLLLTEQRIPANIITTGTKDSSDDGKHFTDFSYDAIVHRHQLNYHANFNDLEDWKDIVSSVDVFVTRQIRTIDLNSDITSFKTGNDRKDITILLNEYGDDKIKEDILSASIFYKIHSFSLDDNLNGYIQKEGMLDSLEQKETLPDDPFSHNEMTGSSYVYNSRLHIGAIHTKLTPMLPVWIFANTNLRLFDIDANVIQMTNGMTEVHLASDSGDKVMISNFTIPSFRGFTPLISYPDIRARKIVWNIKVAGKEYHKIFDMRPHPFLNMAYNIEKVAPINLDDFEEGLLDISDSDDMEYSPNKLKVSEINNPFYFPLKNTYTPSNGEIIAMCSNTADVSTGQFGQYPLYVFCDDGIYSMFVGEGDIVYARSAPMARDVCINKNVVPIDNAVIFVTQQGIMAISGGKMEKLSGTIEGEIECQSPIISKIISLSGDDSIPDELQEYMKDYSIGFNYSEREIIISNPEKNYSYIYGIISAAWYRRSGKINGFVRNSYPECLAIIGNGISDMDNKVGTIGVALITKPMKISTFSFKKISQASLRGLFLTSKLGFYILGSNDCKSFKLVARKETRTDMRDLIIKMIRSNSYKYITLCVSGNLKHGSSIALSEFTVETSFANRLR